ADISPAELVSITKASPQAATDKAHVRRVFRVFRHPLSGLQRSPHTHVLGRERWESEDSGQNSGSPTTLRKWMSENSKHWCDRPQPIGDLAWNSPGNAKFSERGEKSGVFF